LVDLRERLVDKLKFIVGTSSKLRFEIDKITLGTEDTITKALLTERYSSIRHINTHHKKSSISSSKRLDEIAPGAIFPCLLD
jgi:hypothetical protein